MFMKSAFKSFAFTLCVMLLAVLCCDHVYAQSKEKTPEVPGIEFRDHKILLLELQNLNQQRQLLEASYQQLTQTISKKQMDASNAYSAIFKAAKVDEKKYRLEGDKFVLIDPPKPVPIPEPISKPK